MTFVDEAIVEFRKYAPKFTIVDENHLQALLCPIAFNSVKGKAKWFSKKRRELAAARGGEQDSVLALENSPGNADKASMILNLEDKKGCLHMALELLDPDDRDGSRSVSEHDNATELLLDVETASGRLRIRTLRHQQSRRHHQHKCGDHASGTKTTEYTCDTARGNSHGLFLQ